MRPDVVFLYASEQKHVEFSQVSQQITVNPVILPDFSYMNPSWLQGGGR